MSHSSKCMDMETGRLRQCVCVSAFPVPAPTIPSMMEHLQLGMTLRDYFAAAALQGYLAWSPPDCSGKIAPQPEKLAKDCYIFSDAMLAAREAE